MIAISASSVTGSCRSFGAFTLDLADERLIGPDGPVRLGNKAFQVLAMLVEQQGRLLTKDALFASVWDGMLVSESSLTSVVKELRRALGDDTRAPTYIESVYGRGYRLIPDVREAEGATSPPPPRPAPPPPQPGPAGRPPLVLVGAFRDEGVRATHPHIANELREETIAGLARLREIQLLADEGERHAEWSALDYQLSATLVPDGAAVKVIARVKRLKDGRVVWAETMALAGAGDAAHWVEKVVRRIVTAALPALDDDVSLGLPVAPGDHYGSYLLAKRLSFTAKDFGQATHALDMLRQIIEARPDFALAYPPLVRLYNTDYSWTALGATGVEQRAEALRLAKLGLAADYANAHAYTVLGFCYLWHGERALARSSLQRALALNPYNRVRVQEAATAFTYLGDFDVAEELLARAVELDPVPDGDICEDVGRLRLARGNYAGAREMLEQVVPGSIWADLYLGACHLALGCPEGAARIAAWRERIEACWHGGRTPSAAELLAWVRRHHPLPPGSDQAFYAPIEQALTD